MKKEKKTLAETGLIEFVPAKQPLSSAEFLKPAKEAEAPVFPEMLAPTTTLEEMPPAIRELAQPKLPVLEAHNRARLLMQSPNRLFFYWSIGSNPFQTLNKALGAQTANYTLVLKLIDIRRDTEEIHPIEAEGTWWFDVESDSEYRVEIGFYAPNRPYVRALFSNTVATPRKSPSPRVDTESDWSIPANRFARVLEVAGFALDAFDVAIAGDDLPAADRRSRDALTELVGAPDAEAFDGIAAEEIRYAMLLLAAGAAIESLRWKISPALFAILQERAAILNAGKALTVLKERFDIEADDITEEELGTAVYGASLINFPKRLRTRRALPKLQPVSSSVGVPPSGGLP